MEDKNIIMLKKRCKETFKEQCVNYEDFIYTIPFSIALSKKIKEESLYLDICTMC